ncbi:10974_t:CDS:2 [Scutellospora calospora]|uniref:10974_t:CDS:1 n=1 Tax=Scutellospora calospora TaxID=85575 RepID=A0ACA9K047_9GLOM|nr:10974_t:CDS:2 [Scutellospora calospora]
MYLQTYYSPPTIERSTSHEAISAADNTSMFEDHISNFFEYTIKRANENNTLYEVNQYLAQDFLAIPSTSVASEQIFSCAGRTINDDRVSLDPDTVTALICQ